MSLHTTVSQEHPTTQSRPLKVGQFRSGTQHPRWKGSSVPPETMDKLFGSIRIVSPTIHRVKGYPHVKAKCEASGITKVTNLRNLEKGLTKTFFKNGVVPFPNKKLYRRCDAAFQRCNNPNNKYYAKYGGRGVEVHFDSPMTMAKWIYKHLGNTPPRMELDRIDNNGHYEAGNLRWATRTQQIRNRRNTSKIMLNGVEIPLAEFNSPYSVGNTYVLAVKKQMTGEQIIERYNAKYQSTT